MSREHYLVANPDERFPLFFRGVAFGIGIEMIIVAALHQFYSFAT